MANTSPQSVLLCISAAPIQASRSTDGKGSLAGFAFQPLLVEDYHGLWLNPDNGPDGKLRQRLIDALPRGPDVLGELLLGQVVGHPHPIGHRLAEPLGHVEERPGYPPWHVTV